MGYIFLFGFDIPSSLVNNYLSFIAGFMFSSIFVSYPIQKNLLKNKSKINIDMYFQRQSKYI